MCLISAGWDINNLMTQKFGTNQLIFLKHPFWGKINSIHTQNRRCSIRSPIGVELELVHHRELSEDVWRTQKMSFITSFSKHWGDLTPWFFFNLAPDTPNAEKIGKKKWLTGKFPIFPPCGPFDGLEEPEFLMRWNGMRPAWASISSVEAFNTSAWVILPSKVAIISDKNWKKK